MRALTTGDADADRTPNRRATRTSRRSRRAGWTTTSTATSTTSSTTATSTPQQPVPHRRGGSTSAAARSSGSSSSRSATYHAALAYPAARCAPACASTSSAIAPSPTASRSSPRRRRGRRARPFRPRVRRSRDARRRRRFQSVARRARLDRSRLRGTGMKALVIHRYGGPGGPVNRGPPAPVVGGRDVLIDVKAASLNPLDSKLRAGKVELRDSAEAARNPRLRCRPAVASACGGEVTRFNVGDEVFVRLEKLPHGRVRPGGRGPRGRRAPRAASAAAGSERPGRGVALAGTVWKHISSDHAAVASAPGAATREAPLMSTENAGTDSGRVPARGPRRGPGRRGNRGAAGRGDLHRRHVRRVLSAPAAGLHDGRV